MSELANKKCIPCAGGVPPLKGREVTRLLKLLGNDWKAVKGHHLEKRYDFPDFRQALGFTNRVGTLAEEYRKEKAMLWLGHEMPKWGTPCPIQVKATLAGAGGATTFDFRDGCIWSQHMQIEGALDKLLNSVLPHEVTHTVLAYYFRCPLPRWADEGGAVLSENDEERNRHEQRCRQLVGSGQAYPLERLFRMREYPRNVEALYAQGYSVTNFLVSASNRQTFLSFLRTAMQNDNWDNALQTHYHYRSVRELEQAWLNHLKNTRRPPAAVAQNRPSTPASAGKPDLEPGNRIVVRLTVPPVQPDLSGNAVFRGAAPERAEQHPWPPAAAPRENASVLTNSARNQPVSVWPALKDRPDDSNQRAAPPSAILGTPRMITNPDVAAPLFGQ